MKVLRTNTAQSSVVDTEELESHHNHNESTKWFFYTVFHDPVGRSSERTHNQKKQDHGIKSGRGGRKGLGQCCGTQSSTLQLKQEDCDMIRLGIYRFFFFFCKDWSDWLMRLASCCCDCLCIIVGSTTVLQIFSALQFWLETITEHSVLFNSVSVDAAAIIQCFFFLLLLLFKCIFNFGKTIDHRKFVKLQYCLLCFTTIDLALFSLESWNTNSHRVTVNSYCKTRIFRTHSIFVSWALQPFVRMKFSYSRWPLRILWLVLYLSHAFYFRTEAAAYEIYENFMHTKYSGFTVCWYSFCRRRPRHLQ